MEGKSRTVSDTGAQHTTPHIYMPVQEQLRRRGLRPCMPVQEQLR